MSYDPRNSAAGNSYNQQGFMFSVASTAFAVIGFTVLRGFTAADRWPTIAGIGIIAAAWVLMAVAVTYWVRASRERRRQMQALRAARERRL